LFAAINAANDASVNIRNNIRIGDTSLTPLQFVYEAADCRMWYTVEMLYSQTFLWERGADAAFEYRTENGSWSSPFCVAGSTGHPTSLSGGLQNETLGPQTPPPGSRSQVEGWLVNGTILSASSPAQSDGPGSSGANGGAPASASSGAPVQIQSQSPNGAGRLTGGTLEAGIAALVIVMAGMVLL